MGVVAQCREGVYKYFADVEDAEKCFHVPVTLSEALSTSDGVAGTWKRFSASSMLATWALGSWGWGVVVIWWVCGVFVGSWQAGGVDRELEKEQKNRT
jgi:hypothetical protein